jgi:hypothetical protein
LIGAELEILSTPGEGTVLRLALRMTPEMLWPPYRPRLRYI